MGDQHARLTGDLLVLGPVEGHPCGAARPRGWLVRRENQDEPIGTYATEAEAQEAGRRVAHEDEIELTIHGQGGTSGEKCSYGHDPRHISG
jgi:hypothetical protein